MKLIRFAIQNIKGYGFRSLAIFLSVLVIAGLLVGTTVIIKGTQSSLNSGLQRLGADIVVIPLNTQDTFDTALLTGKEDKNVMPSDVALKVGAIPGIASVSAQTYLSTLYGADCCSFSETPLIVFDPSTDFTITPWLKTNLGRSLSTGEIIGGSSIFIPRGAQYISIYGYNTTLAGNLSATGTGIDQTIFMTQATAQAIAQSSFTTAAEPLTVPSNGISSVLVKVKPGVDAHKIALQIFQSVPNVSAIESPNLFGTYRQQITGLLFAFFVLMIILWAAALFLIAMMFSMSVNERKRELAVLRAIGATRNYVLRSVLAEASILALGGAAIGIAGTAALLFLFQGFLSNIFKLPFLFPSAASLAAIFGIGVIFALVTVVTAVLVPALRISREELAIAMRE
jgi:putative ABC transport system permease protein